MVDLITVKNLARALEDLQKSGFWSVATMIDKQAESLYQFEFPEKTVLILGSEGKGVSRLIADKADFKVYLPMHGKIDSLNISQSAAVFLSHWRYAS